MSLNLNEIVSVSLILFSIIDIMGAIPIIITIKEREGILQTKKATIIAGVIMIAFLFLGNFILKLFALDVQSFSIAGAIVILILGFEMLLGITIMKFNDEQKGTGSVIPLAFPLIAGAGVLSTILSLRAVYEVSNILIGIILNLIMVYLVLRNIKWVERMLGRSGITIMRRVFGIILLAIAVKILKTNFFAL